MDSTSTVVNSTTVICYADSYVHEAKKTLVILLGYLSHNYRPCLIIAHVL